MFLDEDGNKLTGPPLDWGLTATFRDINGDGLPISTFATTTGPRIESGSTTARHFARFRSWPCAI